MALPSTCMCTAQGGQGSGRARTRPTGRKETQTHPTRCLHPPSERRVKGGEGGREARVAHRGKTITRGWWGVGTHTMTERSPRRRVITVTSSSFWSLSREYTLEMAWAAVLRTYGELSTKDRGVGARMRVFK